MLRFIFGMFLVLHGLVHLLYAGQSARRFELKPGMSGQMVRGPSRNSWETHLLAHWQALPV